MTEKYGLTYGPAPKSRTTKLQKWLLENDFAGFLMIRTDEYQGEYLPTYAERLHWLTGFSGSAGHVIVGREKSAIFVDGRYSVQVQDEVDYDVYSVQHLTQQPSTEWIANTFTTGDVIAYDPWLLTPTQVDMFNTVALSVGARLVASKNPIDILWDNQPDAPVGKVTVHDIEYAGVHHRDKIKMVCQNLRKKGLDSCVFTASCSIAWLLNIRGSDVPFNPVMLGYCIVHSDETVEIYTNVDKIDDSIVSHLGSNVMIKDFNAVDVHFSNVTGKIGIDFSTVPEAVKRAISQGTGEIVQCDDIVRAKKAFKNDAEQEAMRQCHLVDGAVMARMLHWIDTTPISQQDEWTNAKKLEEFRSQAKGFKDFSFDTISGFGANGAICHYRVNDSTALKFESDTLYLLDSGSQYVNGTTDITRTVPIGTPSQDHIHNFTLVLKGLIALTRAKFPKSYTTEQLDCIARAPLFNEGKNYDHGTGHGVGAGLNVHEAPLFFSNKGRDVTMDVGAIVSNEPGYYVAGAYGIRIENLMIAQPSNQENWLEWETITWCPIDRRLIDVTMLDSGELNWINTYHKAVWEKISPMLDGENNVRNWLDTMCQKI